MLSQTEKNRLILGFLKFAQGIRLKSKVSHVMQQEIDIETLKQISRQHGEQTLDDEYEEEEEVAEAI